MCGHVGMMGRGLAMKVQEEMMDVGLLIASVRGRDSVGYAGIPKLAKDLPFVSKRIGPAPIYVTLGTACDAIIGHVRSATIGDRGNVALAHPFHFDNIVGAHNGTLEGNWREPLQADTKEVFGSDSEAIFFNFAYRGVKETISSIRGAWALVWWDDDEGTLNLLRNAKRPLWMARGKSGQVYWASEYWMIQGMVRAGERDYDKFVKNEDDGRFFQQLPVNTWRRFQFNANGEVVQLDDIPLEGAPEPKTVSYLPSTYRSDRDGGSDIWMQWENGQWHQCDKMHKRAIRFDPKFMKVSEQANSKGRLYRIVNGVGYVCKPGQNEITFRDLIEYHTDGACTMCGEFIDDPSQIGYLPNDYSFFTCTDCVRLWMEQADGRALPLEAADLDGLSDVLFEDVKNAEEEEARMVTMGVPPLDTPWVDPANDEDVVLHHFNANNPDNETPRNGGKPDSLLNAKQRKILTTKAAEKVKAKPKRVPEEPDPVKYGMFLPNGSEVLGHGCVNKKEMEAYVKRVNPELLVLPIVGRDPTSKARRDRMVPAWDDDNDPLGPIIAASREIEPETEFDDELPPELRIPPAINHKPNPNVVRGALRQALSSNSNQWDWWKGGDGSKTRH